MSKKFIFPDLGEGITEGELVRWLVKIGDEVTEDQDVAEVETDKALVTIPSPFSGKVEKLCFQEGDSVKVGSVLMEFSGQGNEQTQAPSPKNEQEETDTPPPSSEKQGSIPISQASSEKLPPLATPHTRKIARELGVDLKLVNGSGANGRITEEDVRNFAKQAIPSNEPTPIPSQQPPTPQPSNSMNLLENFGPTETVPLKGIRKKISDNMLEAEAQSVMVTHIDEAEVDVLIKIRKQKADFAKEKGVKLTLLPFLMKACVIALKDHPSLNASLVNDQIYYKKYYHFGFAVDTEAGLMVPVIKDIDKKSILHLAAELTELSERARSRKIKIEEFQGHSFSITNIGSIGGKAFTPILNYPDAAILGVGRAYEKPIVRNGAVVIANVLPLCLTFDHRITDGATAARFVSQVIQYLKDPDLLLLEDGED